MPSWAENVSACNDTIRGKAPWLPAPLKPDCSIWEGSSKGNSLPSSPDPYNPQNRYCWRMWKEEKQMQLGCHGCGHTKLFPHHLSTSPIRVFVPSSLCHPLNLQRTNLQQIFKRCEPCLSAHPSASRCYNRFHLTSEKPGDSKASGDKGVLALPLKGFRSGALNMDKLLRQAFIQVYKHHGAANASLARILLQSSIINSTCF